jgi:hypothetical protein
MKKAFYHSSLTFATSRHLFSYDMLGSDSTLLSSYLLGVNLLN